MQLLRNQTGIVSVLTATFFSLLVLIITIATLTVQTRELRLSTDADQSNRAFFAAQAGLESAIKQLKTTPGLTKNSRCDQPSGVIEPTFSEPDIEITCLLITDGDTEGAGTLAQEQSAQLNLHGSDVGQMVLRWHENAGDGVYPYAIDDLYRNVAGRLPNRPSWNLPALMELTVYSYPKTAFTVDQAEARTILLRPHLNGGEAATLNTTNAVQTVKCQEPGYSCRVLITDFPANKYHVVRFRPRYTNTKYQALFFAGGCDPDVCPATEINQGRTRIDVTARAGQVYRRVVAHTVGAVEPFSTGLDYVIFTQGDICKSITVPNGGAASGLLGGDGGCLVGESDPFDEDDGSGDDDS